MSVRLASVPTTTRPVVGEAFRALVLFSGGAVGGLLTVAVLRVAL